ncbi:fungal specific transcription factor domain-containing protein [Aspergillus affinis]|uniref:fungal specific transcription factor domain-containing protein n=1 Tax=Aspergillus affinis TaxID=1070780 RepID=UPI0022FDDB1C|nr:uncharacterized protein KD926_002655 [Aspergillus affinis]KAI9035901.1 hypothetical protein KD926_002655 [Aspergillus affinis]
MQFNDAPKVLANAIRQANDFDLNRNPPSSGVCPIEAQQTRQVLYVLDKEFSLHSGLPPMIRMSHQAADPIQHGNEDAGDVLRYFYSLATMEEEIYEELYSATAQERPGMDLLDASFKLERKLRTWRNELSFDTSYTDGLSSQSNQAILLSLMFNNCLITIHRLPAIHCPKTGLYSCHAGSNSEIAGWIDLAKKIRTEAALSCIESVQKLKVDGPWPFWLLPSPIIVSLILLLTTIIYDPETSLASQIVDSINSGVELMRMLNDKSCGEFMQMLRIAAGTANIARKLQQRSQDDIAARKIAQVALENAVMELRRGMRPRNRNQLSQQPRSSKKPPDRMPEREELHYDTASAQPFRDDTTGIQMSTVQLDPWQSLSSIGELDPSPSACDWSTGNSATSGLSEPIIWEDFISSTSTLT